MTATREPVDRESLGPIRRLAVVLGVVVVGAIAAGVYYYRSYESSYGAEIGRQLAAIADLKVGEIVQWRRERLGDAGVLYRNPGFTDLVMRSFGEGGAGRCRSDLQDWLNRIRDAYGYDRVFVLDARGVERCATPDTREPVARHLVERLPKFLAAGRVEFLDFHRDEPEGAIHLAVVVPILDVAGNQAPLGALVLRIDPRVYLYPLIKRWPVPSATGETLLVRRDGSDALFLNELRFRDGSALALRIPLSRTETPAVKALFGREGVEEGVDYRDIAVIAATRTIPDSPWALVARVDVAEVLGPVRGRLREVVLMIGALSVAAVASVGFFWRHHRARHYRERYEATVALHAVAARQQALLSAIPDIVMEVDDRKVYTWANRPGLEFFGDDVVGHEAAHYFEGEQAIYGEVQPLFAGQEDVVYLESWQRRKDGEKRLLAWWCRVLKNSGGRVIGALSTARDVTESRQAEEALAVHARIASVFLAIPDDGVFDEVLRVVLEILRSPFGVFGYIDESGALVVPTMTRQVWDRCQVPEKNIVFPRATWGDSSWPRAIREKAANFSNQPSSAIPGGHVPISRHVSVPVVLRDEVVGLFQVANKDTDYSPADVRSLEAIATYVAPLLGARLVRERAEAALRARDRELQARNEDLTRYTYAVSHDLKSPLVTIKTFLGYLQHDLTGSDQERIDTDLHYLHAATTKMSRLLDELLELSRVGRLSNPTVAATLQEVVGEALDLVAGGVAERGVEVRVTGDPLVLVGDRPRLVEVYQNLIDNAVKFMGEQANPRVEVGYEQRGDEIVLFVRDNGKGIDPRHADKLFGLFEKLDPESAGTGIGLALVKRIVEVHGGRIWVESEGPGRGAAFRFTLPSAKRETA